MGPDAGTRADVVRLAGVSPSLLFLSEMGREEAVEQKAWEGTLGHRVSESCLCAGAGAGGRDRHRVTQSCDLLRGPGEEGRAAEGP